MKQKIVYVRSYGPLSASKTIEIGWEDVWLRVHCGRHLLSLAPCLVSRTNLQADIAIAEKIANDPDAETREFHKKETEHLCTLLGKVDQFGRITDQTPRSTFSHNKNPGHDFALANIYTRAPWINRAEANLMLASYLAALGMHDCKFKWKTSGRLLSWPVTLETEAVATNAA